MKLLVGCDPEMFVRNPNSGQMVTAWGMIPGTKAKPFKVKKGAVQVDGMALEINITPVNNRADFITNCTTVMDQLKEMIPGYEIVMTPTARFDPIYWDTEVPAAAKAMGCDPDFCAWTDGTVNNRPDNPSPFRAAGGHIHLGWDRDVDIRDPSHIDDCCTMAKQLDYYLGINSLRYDPDSERRKLYGQAGAFRPKSYGMEYRTLSNAWMLSPKLMGWVFDAAQKAYTDLVAGQEIAQMYGNRAQIIINNNDTDWPRKFGNMGQNLLAPPMDHLKAA